MRFSQEISIWFFIGVSLLVNGALILAAGLYEFVKPPANPVVLYHLHASVWWGAILLLIGAIYCIRFRPSGESDAAEKVNTVEEEIHVS